MRVKVSEATEVQLDWMVPKAEGHKVEPLPGLSVHSSASWSMYSTDWSQGGPIIDSIKGAQFKSWLESGSRPESRCEFHIHNYEGNWIQFGPTPLIAAMRCYVASKLGDEVDVPEELV